MRDPRYPCEPDPNWKPPAPVTVKAANPNIVRWCAPGYYRPVSWSQECVVDPNWQPPASTSSEYINVNGTLFRRSELGVPDASHAGPPSSLASGSGLALDSNTLLLIGGGLLL